MLSPPSVTASPTSLSRARLRALRAASLAPELRTRAAANTNATVCPPRIA